MFPYDRRSVAQWYQYQLAKIRTESVAYALHLCELATEAGDSERAAMYHQRLRDDVDALVAAFNSPTD